MAVRIEDAGFDIRDQIMWIYGSGFPKSHNVGKSIDKMQGNQRQLVGPGNSGKDMTGGSYGNQSDKQSMTFDITKGNSIGEGWGTALKPAHEPIVMARKPIEGTVAENTLQYGVGGLNIDGTRIQMQDGDKMDIRRYNAYHDTFNSYEDGESAKGKEYVVAEPHEGGRWPANVIMDEHAGQILDKQSGNKKSSKRGSKYNKPTEHTNTYTPAASDYRDDNTYGDEGGASRFFYCPKASKKDREEGNIHPTVKPTDLMAYLIRLVTPKGGIVLDPFMGSGSTGKAAMIEGMSFVGIEREKEYYEIAKQRIEYEKEKRKFW
jgi:site-specific DNA-methyltransferase (adenine-specific)